MRGLLNTLKKIFFWNYARNTWQWDVLCVVILIFIFLTPKEWLSSSERPRSKEHQSAVVKTLVLSPEVVPNEADRGQIETQVRKLTGRPNFEIVDVRKVVGPDGGTTGFEVDIR